MPRTNTIKPLFLSAFVLQSLACGVSAPGSLRSADKRFEARLTGTQPNMHYQVVALETQESVLTTHALYDTPNDAKAARWSEDEDCPCFAVAYHYGHDGTFTWIGVWNAETARLITTRRLEGWQREIPDGVFD